MGEQEFQVTSAQMDEILKSAAAKEEPQICHKIRKRIQALDEGRRIREQEEIEADRKKHEQIGAMQEAEYWLRLFQTGQVKSS